MQTTISQLRPANSTGLLCYIRHSADVDVYIIDSGVYENHADFGGRATTIANFVNSEPQSDTCGHGNVYSFFVVFNSLSD